MKKAFTLLVILSAFKALYAQTVLLSSDLPKMVKNDTIYLPGESWIQTTRSEVKQRAEQKSCEKKLNRIHSILSKKDSIQKSMDSLLVTLEKVESEKDSLNKAIQEMTVDEAAKCQADLNALSDRFTSISYQLYLTKDKLKAVRKKQLLLYLVIGAEAVLIILIL